MTKRPVGYWQLPKVHTVHRLAHDISYAHFKWAERLIRSNDCLKLATDAKWKKRSEETQTLRAGCSKAEPKIFAPPQTPFLGARDGQNLISWRWSLPLPTNPVWLGSIHAISSYRGNSPTHPHTHPQPGPITIHCTAASAQCNYLLVAMSSIHLQFCLQKILTHSTAASRFIKLIYFCFRCGRIGKKSHRQHRHCQRFHETCSLNT